MSSSGFQRPGTRSSDRAFGISLSVDSAVSASGQAAAIDASKSHLPSSIELIIVRRQLPCPLPSPQRKTSSSFSSSGTRSSSCRESPTAGRLTRCIGVFLFAKGKQLNVDDARNANLFELSLFFFQHPTNKHQIPFFLLEAGWAGAAAGGQQLKSIVVALPNPSAAVAAAARASAAVGAVAPFPSSRSSSASPAPIVGYSIPFEDVHTDGVTKLTFCDFASLLTEMGDDPLLSKRSVVVVAGAGARALPGDLVLSLLKRVLRRRPELRVVVTCSDSGAAESVARFFGWKGAKEEKKKGNGGAAAAETALSSAAAAAAPAAAAVFPPPSPVPAVLQLPRSLHPIRVQYLAEPAPNYLEAAAEAIVEALRRSSDGGGGGGSGGGGSAAAPPPSSLSSGDILFFVSGASEAVAAADAILGAARRASKDSGSEEEEDYEDDYLNDARVGKKRGRGRQLQQQQRQRLPLPSVLRLHAGAPASHASAALSPPPRDSSNRSSSSARRVLVATDEGVAGLSLPAVGVVVDSLLQRRTKSDNASFSSSNLKVEETVPCSALLAATRASRAGVSRPGLCLRLSTKGDFEEAVARRGRGGRLENAMASTSTSTSAGNSIDLTSACLRLKAFGVDNLRSHEWGPSFLERAAWKEGEERRKSKEDKRSSRPLYSDPLPPARPPAAALARALEVLFSLGALDSRGKLTQRGKLLAELPPTLDPRWGASLLSAALDSDDSAPSSNEENRKKVGPRAAADVATIAAFASLRPVWLPPFAVKAALAEQQQEGDDSDEEERRRRTQLSGAALSAELRLAFAAAEGDPITALNVWRAWSRVGSKLKGPRASSKWCSRNGLDLRVLLRAGDVRRQLLMHLARLGVRVASNDGDDGDNERSSGVSAVVRALARGFFASGAVSVGPAPPEPGVGGGLGGGGGAGGSAGAGVGVGGGGRRAAQTATGDNGGWPAFELLSSSSRSSPKPLLRIAPPSVLSASFAGALGLELPTPKAILFFDASVSDGGGFSGGGRNNQQQQRPRRDRPVAEVRSALEIEPGLLLEVAPHFYERGGGGGGRG